MILILNSICYYWLVRSSRGRDRMVVGFTTVCAINQCLSPIPLLVRIPLKGGVLDITVCGKVCQ